MRKCHVSEGKCHCYPRPVLISAKSQANQRVIWVVLGDQSDPTPLASFRGDYERKIAKCMWFLPFGLGRAEGERWDMFVTSLEGLEEEDPSWAAYLLQPTPPCLKASAAWLSGADEGQAGQHRVLVRGSLLRPLTLQSRPHLCWSLLLARN